MKLYHLSPVPNLDKVGLHTGKPSRINYRGARSPYVYLGTLEYIKSDYMEYAPPGVYYLYEVDTAGLYLDDKLPEGQYRYGAEISAQRLNLVSTYILRKQKKV